MKFASAALMAGNKILLKPAECVPRTSIKLNEILSESGWNDYFQHGFISIQNIESIIAD